MSKMAQSSQELEQQDLKLKLMTLFLFTAIGFAAISNGIWLAATVGDTREINEIKQHCIDGGYAKYDLTTDEFEWIDGKDDGKAKQDD